MSTPKILTLEHTEELLKSLLVISRTVQHVLEQRAIELSSERLSSSKVQILRLLGSHASQTPTQIAQFLTVSKPAVTQILAALEEGKLIRRSGRKNDRRGFQIALTAKGKRLLDKLQDEQRHIVRSAFDRASTPRPEGWISTLSEISTALAAAQENYEDYCYQCGAHGDGSCVLVGGEARCLFRDSQNGPAKPTRRRAD